MVKVLKPTPKSLNKSETKKGIIKKTNLQKGHDIKKNVKASLAEESSYALKKDQKKPKTNVAKSKISEQMKISGDVKDITSKIGKNSNILQKEIRKKKIKSANKNTNEVKIKKGVTTSLTPLVKPASNKKQQKNLKLKKKQNVNSESSVANILETQERKLTKLEKKNVAKTAFKKQQLKKTTVNKTKKQNKQKLTKTTIEPVPFDEEKFNSIVNIANIKKIAASLKTLVEKEVANKKTSIFSDYRYFLNVICFKIPDCPKRMVKMSLKHSLVGKDDDILIVVPDLQRGAKYDYEPTKQHYEDIFREAGVSGLTIMPFNQLRKEYNTFEAVRKLGNTYDYFMCDGRLVGQVAGFCGKVFQKPRTTFHAVRLVKTKDIKNEIKKSLCRTAYKQIQKGDVISIPVGNHNYTTQQLAENIQHVISNLKTLYPGGLGNIRSLYIKIDIVGTSALPIYASMSEPPAETPYVVGVAEQRMLSLKKEANAILSKFSINKDAEIRKLSKAEELRKRNLNEKRKAVLLDDTEEKQMDNDGEDVVIPSKRARKELKTDIDKNINEKNKRQKTSANTEDDVKKDDNEEEDEDDDAEDEGENEEEEEDENAEVEDDDEDGNDVEDEDSENEEEEDDGDEDDDDDDDDNDEDDDEDEDDEDDDGSDDN